MTISKITLYNGALRILGERKLSSLSEDRPARYYLDDAWDDGAVDACLEEGFWNWAIRSVQFDPSEDVTPEFGHAYAFEKPADFIRTAGICQDEFFQTPLDNYIDEVDHWFASVDPLYVQYVSNDASYGTNYAAWPESFNKFVQAYLADQIKALVTGNDSVHEKIEKHLKKARINARSKDAMNGPIRFAPSGTFVRARMSRNIRSDRRG